MRILLVLPSFPYPPTWGYAIRICQFVRLLSIRHSVTLISYAEPGESERVGPLKAMCAAVHLVPRTSTQGAAKRLEQISSMFSRVSHQRRSMYSDAMQRKLTEVLASERFDVVQVESSQLAGFELDERALHLIDEHNIEYELLYRMYLSERSALRRIYNWIEYKKFEHEEVKVWQSVDGVVTTSTREEHIIRRLANGTPVVTVPNAVDVDYFHPATEATAGSGVVLTGLMKYRPNVDAAIYFVQDILPRILLHHPDVVFYIVGGSPPPEVKRLAGPNVVVTDTVPDVRPYVYKAAVFVVPLRMGGGTRLKVLEGLSMMKPMVSTSVGCEGIDVEHGTHILIADEAAAFADAVLRLLDDHELARQLASHGRALVEQRYRWETVVNQLEAFYDSLAAARSGGAARG